MIATESQPGAGLLVLSIAMTLFSGMCTARIQEARVAETGSLQIKVDQVGYLPGRAKVAIVADADAILFEVKRASDLTTAFKGELGPATLDGDTGDIVRAADFSKLNAAGTYYLNVPGVGRSWTFSIRPDVYVRTYYLAMRAFYGQRCGTRVDLGPEFPGYAHAACHLKEEFHPSSGKQGERDNVGGWHDAGDYGRYIVNSGITVGTLLWTWGNLPTQGQTHQPEPSRKWQRRAGHSERSAMEPGMDAEDAGCRWRGLAQTDQREFPRVRDA